MNALHLEHGLIGGACLVLAGLAGSIFATWGWAQHSFGDLDPFRMMRTTIPATLLLTLGCQLICCSFYFSMLKLQWHERFAQVQKAD